MIEGIVTRDRQALVRLVVLGSNGSRHDLEYVLDTGFTGYISLSIDEIDALDLQKTGFETVRFAGGNDHDVTTYRATVMWDGQPRTVKVLPLATDHLVGMHLLGGSILTLNVCEGGAASIDVDTVDPFDVAESG